MALTDQQRLERRAFIGGSDAPALAGVNPPRWAQPIDVYLEKVGEAPPREPSRMQAMGSLMEELVGSLFTEATGLRLRRPGKPVRSKVYPWAGGNIDRWAGDGSIYEGKWGERRDEWGPGLSIGTEAEPTIILGPEHEGYTAPEVPLRYAVQVQHYLAVTDRPLAYLAVLLGYGDFRWYALHRNDILINDLMAIEERFWIEHVIPRVPPPPDGSDGYGRHLRRTYAASDDLELVATPEQQQLVEGLRAALAGEAEYARIRATFEQQLQASMGPASRLTFPGGHIAWRTNRPGTKVEWEPLATRLLQFAYGSSAPSADPFYTLSEVMPDEWPTTKKAQAELVRRVARHLELASNLDPARPWKPHFDSDEQEGDDASST